MQTASTQGVAGKSTCAGSVGAAGPVVNTSEWGQDIVTKAACKTLSGFAQTYIPATFDGLDNLGQGWQTLVPMSTNYYETDEVSSNAIMRSAGGGRRFQISE
jgi:hypothetical protein